MDTDPTELPDEAETDATPSDDGATVEVPQEEPEEEDIEDE